MAHAPTTNQHDVSASTDTATGVLQGPWISVPGPGPDLYRVHGDTVPTKCRSEAHTVHRPLMHPSTTSPIFPRHPFTQPSTSSARKVCVVRVRVRLRYTHQTHQTHTHALPRAHTRSMVSGSGGVRQGNAFGSERASNSTSTSTSTGRRPRCSLASCIVPGSTLL